MIKRLKNQGLEDMNSKKSSAKDMSNFSKHWKIQSNKKTKNKEKEYSEDETDLSAKADSNDARTEMKALMKTISSNFKLKVNKVFSSFTNKEILNKLISELLKLMVPYFNPIWKQLYE